MGGLVAILDVGKTNAKLTVTETEGGAVVWSVQRPCQAVSGASTDGPPLRRLGALEIGDWLVESLARVPERSRIEAIVPVAHGAAMAVIDDTGALVAAPDYEDPAFAEPDPDYVAGRDPFARTLSPLLPLGLNLGRQIHFLQTRRPALYARARTIMPYAQFWAWLLSGVAASEATSLGAHTDLWLPREGGFAPRAVSAGWAGLFAPLRAAGDVLGPVRPELATLCGLDPGCRVLCGIHDSNAAYLCYRAHWPDGVPFAVLSSGTWTIAMADGVDLDRLDPSHDMLANVDAFGRPLATARFMGGREYAAIAPEGARPTVEALGRVVARRAMALPAFAPAGPFQGHAGRLVGADDLGAEERAALATLYLALMADHVLGLLGVAAPVIVDGPLADNPLFCPLLAALRPALPVLAGAARAGTVGGARLLYPAARDPEPVLMPAEPPSLPGLEDYRTAWTAALPA